MRSASGTLGQSHSQTNRRRYSSPRALRLLRPHLGRLKGRQRPDSLFGRGGQREAGHFSQASHSRSAGHIGLRLPQKSQRTTSTHRTPVRLCAVLRPGGCLNGSEPHQNRRGAERFPGRATCEAGASVGNGGRLAGRLLALGARLVRRLRAFAHRSRSALCVQSWSVALHGKQAR